MAEPRGPTRRDIYLYIYIVYSIICSVFRISERNINPLKPLRLITPTISLNFSRVGISPTQYFKMQVTWTNIGRRIDGALKYGAWIAWTQGPPEIINACALKESVITVVIHSGGEHRDRRITIQPRQNDTFLNAYQADQSKASIRDLRATTY